MKYRIVPSSKRRLLLSLLSLGGLASHPEAMASEWDGYSLSTLVGATQQNSNSGIAVQLPANSYFDATDKAQFAREGSKTYVGADGGGHVKLGYSWQSGNIVKGIDISADTGFDQSVNLNATVQSAPTEKFSITQRIKSTPLVAIRPRIGWVWGNTMNYVTAGLVAAHVTLDTTYKDTIAGTGYSSQSDMRLGAVIGFGTEYALGKAWSLSAQYLYTDLGSMSATTLVKNPTQSTKIGVFDSTVDLRNQSLMFGLTYRFKK